MSVETKFYGTMTPEEMFSDKVTFSIEDIYLRHKWIKADCFAASKLYSNMELLRMDKGFAFYSQRFNGQKPLADSTGYNKRFDLEIKAYLGDDEANRSYYHLYILCKGCELSNSHVFKGPSRPFEAHQLKFDSAAVTHQYAPEQHVDEPSSPYPRSKWSQKGSFSIP